jgi:hypothetical protein
MALVQFVAKRTGAMLDWSELSPWPGVEDVPSCWLPTDAVGSSAMADTTTFQDESQLVSFAVITVRNDTGGLVNFDLRVLPRFPQFLTFHLEPGHQRAFFSAFRRWIGLPRFQVDFLSIAGRAHARRTHTLTLFNVLQTRLDGRIDHGTGRLYVFRPTADGRDLFLA